MPTTNVNGRRRTALPERNKVPKKNWRDDILNVADQCAKAYNFRRKLDGIKYAAIAFWEVIVFAVLFSLGTATACRWLNKIKIADERKKNGHKKGMPRLGGTHERHERLVPDKSQVNDFKRKLPLWFVKDLEHYVLKAQVDYVLGCKMIPKTIDVLIDFNDKPYYGRTKKDESKTLIGTKKSARNESGSEIPWCHDQGGTASYLHAFRFNSQRRSP